MGGYFLREVGLELLYLGLTELFFDRFIERGLYYGAERSSSCIVWEWKDSQVEAVLGETTAGHRSVRVALDTKDAASKRVKCFRCVKPGQRRHGCRNQVSAGVMPGPHTRREAGAAGLSYDGRGAARSRTFAGDTSSPVS